MAYVPMQECVKPTYNTAEALSRGTLFPGLDLPFMNIDAIETEDNKSPSTVQKVKAVAYMTISEANKEAALSAALSEKAYARYMAARKCGVSSVDYADFLEILDRVDENGGNPSQDEFKEAVRRANLNCSAAAAIWATYWKSSSPW